MNQCFNFNPKFTLTLETEVRKPLETNLNSNNLPTSVDAEIINNLVPYIQYEQIELDDNFRTYLECTLISKHVFRTGTKTTPYQKTYKIVRGTQSHVVDFRGSNKQFSFLKISLVCDKIDQHKSIYDSYNVEIASTKIKSLKLGNTGNSYSTFNSVKFDLDSDHDKYLLYCQFVAWYCTGSSIASLMDYGNNEVYQELPRLEEFFTNSNEKPFIDLRRSKGCLALRLALFLISIFKKGRKTNISLVSEITIQQTYFYHYSMTKF